MVVHLHLVEAMLLQVEIMLLLVETMLLLVEIMQLAEVLHLVITFLVEMLLHRDGLTRNKNHKSAKNNKNNLLKSQKKLVM